jgi:hypothetical protein
MIAQQNTRHGTASEANGVFEMIHTLEHDAKTASTDRNLESR